MTGLGSSPTMHDRCDNVYHTGPCQQAGLCCVAAGALYYVLLWGAL
jgi:hypothetical protein